MIRFLSHLFYVFVFATVTIFAQSAESNPYRWWPVIKAPSSVIIVDNNALQLVTLKNGTTSRVPSNNLVESLSGLAAQAVNGGSLDELVWLDITYHDYIQWFTGVKERLRFRIRDTLDQWQLLQRYKDAGIVKGYVLYSFDISEGNNHTPRAGMDHSVNVATTAASLLGGVLISEELEEQAQEMGLSLLLDARDKNELWAFNEFKEHLNKTIALAQEPRTYHNRAIAIAHNMMVIFGMNEPAASLYKWMEPKSTVIGWNLGDEGDFVSQISTYGHIMVASNWSTNLVLLSAGTETWKLETPCKTVDPGSIDYNDGKHAVSFVLSDGDNLQWMMINYVYHPYYWANPDFGSFPFNFGMCLGDLNQACPEVLSEIQRTQPDSSSVVLHGGGYYYPDEIGRSRSDIDREDLLRLHARQIGFYMNRSGSRILMFICKDVDSYYAEEAYQIFAQEIEGLTGMMALQYYPYEGGNGKVMWFPDKNGIDIPVVTAKFSLWANLNLPRSGTPAKIARLINEAAAAAGNSEDTFTAWTVVHSWSGFRYHAGDDEYAENASYLPPGNGVEAAVTPTKWCVDRLENDISVVSAEELIWRIRMKNDPEQTWKAIDALSLPENSQHSAGNPSDFALLGNFPNPFNSTTKIRFRIPEAGFINMAIFNVAGQRIDELHTRVHPGSASISWNAQEQSSGIYFYRIQYKTDTRIGKLVYLR
jgi:hypothetical protein